MKKNVISSAIDDTKVRFSTFFTPAMTATTLISLLLFVGVLVISNLNIYNNIYNVSPYLCDTLDSIAWISGGIFGGSLVDLLLALFLRGNKKAITIEKLIHSLLKYIVGIVVLIGLLIVWLGKEYIAGVLGGVGVLALVIGFGAQKLIGDIIAGVFMVFEGNIEVGDIVTIGDFRGTVIEIGVRSTVLESVGGDRKIITNSNISEFINMSKELSVVTITASIQYNMPVEKTCEVINLNLQRIKDKCPLLKKMPEFAGISNIGDSGYEIKLFGYCEEANKFQAERDMIKEVLLILQENNISLAYPHIEIVK